MAADVRRELEEKRDALVANYAAKRDALIAELLPKVRRLVLLRDPTCTWPSMVTLCPFAVRTEVQGEDAERIWCRWLPPPRCPFVSQADMSCAVQFLNVA